MMFSMFYVNGEGLHLPVQRLLPICYILKRALIHNIVTFQTIFGPS